MSNISRAFDDKAFEWEHYTQTPAGRLREFLNWHYLQPYLPPPSATILDVGAGTGGLGIMLAKAGYTVHLLDISEKMLAIASQKAASHRLTLFFHHTDLTNFVPPEIRFDVICCHTVLAYVSDAAATIQQMAKWLKPNGILSVVFVNRHADVLKSALRKADWRSAYQQLSSSSACADLFGVPRKLYDAETILQLLADAHFKPVAEYGVRIFTDYHEHENWHHNQAELEALIQLETAASSLAPYQRIGRYGQIIARLMK
ncbi:MAG: hypothetical protein CUN55_08910 [Phototrophicales bacterium]|nr:MAG: hypothetical protein CUN55_08910 [Phototrophicales bacterium]